MDLEKDISSTTNIVENREFKNEATILSIILGFLSVHFNKVKKLFTIAKYNHSCQGLT